MYRSDIAIFGTSNYIWINGAQPAIWPLYDAKLRPGTPKGSFPFARLASATSQSVTYLYHQINDTTFAEEPWDDSEFTWGTTEYIHVTDL